jgi:hypothetical protein
MGLLWPALDIKHDSVGNKLATEILATFASFFSFEILHRPPAYGTHPSILGLVIPR